MVYFNDDGRLPVLEPATRPTFDDGFPVLSPRQRARIAFDYFVTLRDILLYPMHLDLDIIRAMLKLEPDSRTRHANSKWRCGDWNTTFAAVEQSLEWVGEADENRRNGSPLTHFMERRIKLVQHCDGTADTAWIMRRQTEPGGHEKHPEVPGFLHDSSERLLTMMLTDDKMDAGFCQITKAAVSLCAAMLAVIRQIDTAIRLDNPERLWIYAEFMGPILDDVLRGRNIGVSNNSLADDLDLIRQKTDGDIHKNFPVIMAIYDKFETAADADRLKSCCMMPAANKLQRELRRAINA